MVDLVALLLDAAAAISDRPSHTSTQSKRVRRIVNAALEVAKIAVVNRVARARKRLAGTRLALAAVQTLVDLRVERTLRDAVALGPVVVVAAHHKV